MDLNKQQNAPPTILRQQDISQVIKHFSFTIQQRFQEIQKNFNYFSCLNSINYQRSDLQKEILNKYNVYKTSDEHQIKLLERFVERILQIFEFFRQKTDQPDILQQMSQKIAERLRQIMKNQTSYHFFVNNRPKVHTTNVKPFGNRSASNDFLSIVGPSCNKQELDINAVFINSKKTRTQTPEKRSVEVGKLFKYIFSVLKRGYLMKLRMEKPEKKSRTIHKETDENTTTISVQGTCAILRNYSQKGNKENNQAGRILNFCKQKLTIINPLTQLSHNKRQYQISQKIKNRSISTNQYSILSSQNPSILKQPSSKIREIDRKVSVLYQILNIEKYSVVRIAKDPQIWKKDQVKRNLWTQNQSKKYLSEYSKWAMKDRVIQINQSADTEQNQYKNQKYLQSCQASPLQYYQQDDNKPLHLKYQDTQTNLNQKHIIQNFELNPPLEITSIQKDSKIISFQNSHNKIQYKNYDDFTYSKNFNNENLTYQQKISYDPVPMKINFKTQQNEYFHSQLTSAQNGRASNSNTIIVYSSRPYSKLGDNVLTDKSSNLMDVNTNRNANDFSCLKSKSTKEQQRKTLRLNLPSMLGDKSNQMNEPNIRMHNNLTNQQKSVKISQKSQYYLQNYHIDSSEDGVFVPLLPRKQKNSENCYENRNDFSIKRKNLVPNFHPLNRCRFFRQKKQTRNSIMIPLMESKESDLDNSILNSKVKNAIY